MDYKKRLSLSASIVIIFSTFLVFFSASPISTTPTKPRPTPTPAPTLYSYELTLPNGSSLNLDENSSVYNIWHDWFIAGIGYYSTQYVYAFNLQTGEIKKIFENDNSSQGITDMAVIGDNLLVSIGGYLAGGGLYRLNLPPDTVPAKLITSSQNGSIIQLDDQYWLQGGEGDACWGYTSYDLLTPKTFKVTHIADASEDCDGNGSKVVSLNYNQSAIVADKVGGTLPNSDIYSTFTQIYQISYNAPKQKNILISKKTMPLGINEIVMDKANNQIILKNNTTTYSFDLKKHTLLTIESYVPLKATPTPSVEFDKLEFKQILPFLNKIPSIKINPKYK
jgi:hypothetical protein